MDRRQFVLALGSTSLWAQAPSPSMADVEWHDAKQFTIEGLRFRDTKSRYDRLPARAEAVVRPEVWNLSRDSAGALVRFVANATAIHARWTLTKKVLAGANMTAIAASGLDLYVRRDSGHWHWLGVGRPTRFPVNTDVLVYGMPKEQREYMLYLPLYNGVTSVEIGVPKFSAIAPAAARPAAQRPLVFYGTSITQGASASRGGMTHLSILGRRFNREVINLGFSGNGRMESEVVRFIAELDAAVFVLDCLPNISAKEVRERTAPAIRILREAHPKTPIVLVEDRNYESSFLVEERRQHNQENHAALRAVFEALRKDHTAALYYLKADDLLGDDGEATIDGSHPTDLGFVRHANAFEKVLRKALK